MIDFCLNNSKYMILARTHKEEIPDLDTLIDSAIARERQYLKDSAAKIDRMDDCGCGTKLVCAVKVLF